MKDSTKNTQPPATPPARASFSNTLPSLADSLSAYLRRVESIPLLSAAEEHRLAMRYHRNKDDREAARTLCLANLRLVVHQAYQNNGYGLDVADLIQAGNIGLLTAVQRFNPTRGVRFATFAVHWIRSSIYDFILNNWRIVKVATTKAQRKLFFNKHKLFASEHERFDAQAVADELDVGVGEVHEMRTRLANTANTSDAMAAGEDDAGAPRRKTEEVVADVSDDAASSLAVWEDRAKQKLMQDAFATLSAREQAVVSARRLDDPPATLQTLAARHKISLERVRQVEAAAMKKMSAYVREHWVSLPS